MKRNRTYYERAHALEDYPKSSLLHRIIRILRRAEARTIGKLVPVLYAEEESYSGSCASWLCRNFQRSEKFFYDAKQVLL